MRPLPALSGRGGGCGRQRGQIWRERVGAFPRLCRPSCQPPGSGRHGAHSLVVLRPSRRRTMVTDGGGDGRSKRRVYRLQYSVDYGGLCGCSLLTGQEQAKKVKVF